MGNLSRPKPGDDQKTVNFGPGSDQEEKRRAFALFIAEPRPEDDSR